MFKLIPTIVLFTALLAIISIYPPIKAVATKLKHNAWLDTSGNDPVMKQYWLVLLKKGPHRDQPDEVIADIQAKHLANVDRLHAEGKIVVAGPMGDNGDLRGIFILDCADSLEAATLVKQDEAVKTGRIIFEIKPWWTAKNCVFK
ncbi:uncharacterized protein YciI [Chitinophaga skermanii]|uniref:Uncharacterized protein YciI n=1 Tax=Chitinophaga skermanii TaxID=331697 RepID=A0A327Q8W8_9BACT|nr:YciI family protein [Chitinophaga skermanii]RAJ00334.1 uncharacterized protein YciI [Chitinophaga skermanii]